MTGDDTSNHDRDLPLAGIRIIDRTAAWGELATRLLADLGAEVIKIEPAGGAASRHDAPVRDGVSLAFAFRNAGKRSVVLDDPARLAELIASADAVVTNDPADVAFADADPGLVLMVITPYGLTGPYAGRVATDPVVAATGGQTFKAGIPEREPLPPPSHFVDHTTSTTAAFAVLCALRQRLRTGVGDVLDFSVNEAAAQMSDWSMPNGVARLRAGIVGQESRKGSGPVYPVFRTKGGFVRLIILSPRQWHAMRAWLGEPEFLQDPSFDGFVARFEVADAVLNPMYEAHFAEMEMEEVSAEAQRRGIVCTPVLPASGVLANEHLRARESFVPQPVGNGRVSDLHAGFYEIDGRRVGPSTGVGEPAAAEPGSIGDHDHLPAGDATPGAPLAGLRVMDFGHGAVGVEIGRMFAEMGADVVKIESITYPDFIRLQTGAFNTPSFTSSSRSKRGFGANAKTDGGRAALLELAKRSDLAVENNAAGVMDDLGLGYSALSGVNPDIVMLSSQLMGATGPWADWRGYGPSTLGPSGILRLWDYPDSDAPAGGATIFPDQFVGRLGAVASLAAIIGRERGVSAGCHIELAQVEGAAGAVGDLLAAEAFAPGTGLAVGSGHESASPWGMFPCAGDDQWVAITCRDDADWRGLVAAMGGSDEDAALGLDDRRARAEEIAKQIAGWTSGLDKHEVAARCQEHGVPAGAMLTGIELESDPHLVARGFPVEIDQPDIGALVLEGPAMIARVMPPPRITAAPRLGEHTREIAVELLGMDPDAVEALIAEGALELPPDA